MVSSMAVEDHPKWKMWSAAYDALEDAAEDAEIQKKLLSPEVVRRAVLARYEAALDQYNKVSDELE